METRQCQNCKQNFAIEPEDFVFYEKIKVPPPTFCPECRMIRRFNYRNENYLYRRNDVRGHEIFSGFSPEAEVKTYENDFWFSDGWDRLATGMDYDFKIPFFEQFHHLLKNAPLPARSVYNMVNSPYCNEASECKNCYLCFNTDYLENCAYLNKVRNLKNSFDVYESADSELCYEGVTLDNCYKTFYSVECNSCVDVYFSKNCSGCTNCFGCVGLRNQSYCYFNEKLSKEEYENKLASIDFGSYNQIIEIKKSAQEFWMTSPVKFYYGINNYKSTGDRIFNSKNLKDCYYNKEVENLAYCQDIWESTSNCYDYSVWGQNAENIYECMTCGFGIANLKFCFNCWENARDLEYCVYCLGCKDCFGCIGLYKNQYCIFNKQYSKEEYFKLREEIIRQMNDLPYIDQKGRIYKYGEFFPYEISPVAYNESLANQFFPISEIDAKGQGFIWRDRVVKQYEPTMTNKDLPDNINDVNNDIINEVLECGECKKAYRIIEMEYDFYKNMKLPLPRICQDCRFIERFKFVNPPKFYDRGCMCDKLNHDHSGLCQNTFRTTYNKNRSEIIYCESCYNKEIS